MTDSSDIKHKREGVDVSVSPDLGVLPDNAVSPEDDVSRQEAHGDRDLRGTTHGTTQKDTPAAETPRTAHEKLTAAGVLREVAELVVVTLVLLVAIRGLLVEPRFIPSSSMEPTLRTEDRLLVEKLSKNLGKEAQRGDILVFYPPPSQLPGGKDLSNDPATVIGRLTGLPFLPYEPAFIKRVIGLPGDRIRVKRGVGVFVNEQLLDERAYIKEPPAYDLTKLGDIGHATIGDDKRPYKDRAEQPIIVPPGMLFMLGDNRNNSEDSHVWGFLKQDRVIGRAWLLFWRRLQPPKYADIINQQTTGG